MAKLIYITIGSEEEAQKLGKSLVEEKLVACVNMFPIRSIYRWKGELQEERELAIIAKTKDELVDRAIKRIKELHPYEVPCIVSIPIEKGNEEFLRWIAESTGG